MNRFERMISRALILYAVIAVIGAWLQGGWRAGALAAIGAICAAVASGIFESDAEDKDDA